MTNINAYVQQRKRGSSKFSIRKTAGSGYFVATIQNKENKKNSVSFNQFEINAIAKWFDYHRNDRTYSFLPSDEQVDAWIAHKGRKYAENCITTHRSRN